MANTFIPPEKKMAQLRAEVLRQDLPVWGGFQFNFYDVTGTREHPPFVHEYTASQYMGDYLVGGKPRKQFQQDMVTLVRQTPLGQSRPEVTTEQALSRVQDMELNRTYMREQAKILSYIGYGDWQNVETIPGDLFYVITFGERRDLPLLWFVISINRARHVMRLHAWATSFLATYFYRIYLGRDKAPRRPGIFALSYLLWRFHPRRLYLEALEHTDKLFCRLLGKDAYKEYQPRPVSGEQEEKEAGEEPQVMQVTETMRHAWFYEEIYNKPQGDTRCVECGINDAGYYLAELGSHIRFCGRGECSFRASRTAACQGLEGQ